MTDPITLDMRGFKCPHPSLRLQKVRRQNPGVPVHILADDPMAKIDIPALCQEQGWTCTPVDGADIAFIVSG